MEKKHSKFVVGENFLNLDNRNLVASMSKSSTEYIVLNDEMGNIFLKIGRNKTRVAAILTFLFNIVLKVLANAAREKR